MGKERAGITSYLAALGLAGLTLFVFAVLQNYGPESAVRRLHAVVYRINRYTPPTVPFNRAALKPADAYELSTLIQQPLTDQVVANVIDRVIREPAYRNTRYSVVRVDYRGPREAIAAVEYDFKNAYKYGVFVLRKPRRSWLVDMDDTDRVGMAAQFGLQ